jgi:carboxyl-terminal processing protease
VAESADDQNVSKLERISEANLPGHLGSEGGGKKAAPPVIRPPAGKKIEDFQLSYALDFLHGKPAPAAPAKTAAAN